ncbi:hypothetical protein V8F20_011875 [Naviculisporaceae sp. PSN 640]
MTSRPTKRRRADITDGYESSPSPLTQMTHRGVASRRAPSIEGGADEEADTQSDGNSTASEEEEDLNNYGQTLISRPRKFTKNRSPCSRQVREPERGDMAEGADGSHIRETTSRAGTDKTNALFRVVATGRHPQLGRSGGPGLETHEEHVNYVFQMHTAYGLFWRIYYFCNNESELGRSDQNFHMWLEKWNAVRVRNRYDPDQVRLRREFLLRTITDHPPSEEAGGSGSWSFYASFCEQKMVKKAAMFHPAQANKCIARVQIPSQPSHNCSGLCMVTRTGDVMIKEEESW